MPSERVCVSSAIAVVVGGDESSVFLLKTGICQADRDNCLYVNVEDRELSLRILKSIAL